MQPCSCMDLWATLADARSPLCASAPQTACNWRHGIGGQKAAALLLQLALLPRTVPTSFRATQHPNSVNNTANNPKAPSPATSGRLTALRSLQATILSLSGSGHECGRPCALHFVIFPDSSGCRSVVNRREECASKERAPLFQSQSRLCPWLGCKLIGSRSDTPDCSKGSTLHLRLCQGLNMQTGVSFVSITIARNSGRSRDCSKCSQPQILFWFQ